MSSAWIGLIGALGGVIVTSVIGLVTAVLNRRWQVSNRDEERADRIRERRAELRLDAYLRFIIASNELNEFLLSQPPTEVDGEADGHVVFGRFQVLRESGEKHFVEFDAASAQVRLLAGEAVSAAREEFADWLIRRSIEIVKAGDPLKVAKGTLEEAQQPLLEAMRVEQNTDLATAP